MEQTEGKGQWLASVQNLEAEVAQGHERVAVLASLAEVRYSVQVAVRLDNVALVAGVLEGHGVHIPLVAVVPPQPLETHAVMVAAMVEVGLLLAMAWREGLLAAAEVVAIIPIATVVQEPEGKSEFIHGR